MEFTDSGKSKEQIDVKLHFLESVCHKVLIATDMMGLGTYIKGVRHFINFKLPKKTEAYKHIVVISGRVG